MEAAQFEKRRKENAARLAVGMLMLGVSIGGAICGEFSIFMPTYFCTTYFLFSWFLYRKDLREFANAQASKEG